MSAPDALTPDFLAEIKVRTEDYWARRDPHPDLYGFQFQRGTRWRPGLSDAELTAYEAALGLRLPDDARLLLRTMNGTDRPTVHVAMSPVREGPGVYSYPADLERVKAVAADWREWWPEVAPELGLTAGDSCFPVFAHRGVVCTGDPRDSRVVSITQGDSIVYAPSLRDWLEAEFLPQRC